MQYPDCCLNQKTRANSFLYRDTEEFSPGLLVSGRQA